MVASKPEQIEMPDAEVVFYPTFFDPDESRAYFQELSNSIHWQQQSIDLLGSTIQLPRLTAWYGDMGKSYTYSGLTVHPESWTPILLAIKSRIETAANISFNSVLLNFYRGGQDSVSWHSDDEPELGTNPVIGSVSFGATRLFQFKHKSKPELRQSVELTPGSLLIMRGTTQHFWKHQIPKTKKPVDPRINLTFRVIN
ncbi:MAG: alpha-ketoglutarate-dependent dioxygenase AlkB family protein [Aggregatilineales bacterium]